MRSSRAAALMLVAVPALGQIPPRPDLVPAKPLISTFATAQAEPAVQAAARRAAAALGLQASETDGALLIEAVKLHPRDLDRYCEYPVIDGLSGRPLETYASLQRRVQRPTGQQEIVRGRWSLALNGARGSYRLASRCLAQVGIHWGSSSEALGLREQVATSTGEMEAVFVARLSQELGLAALNAIPMPAAPLAATGFQERCPLQQEIPAAFLPTGPRASIIPGEPRTHCRGMAFKRVEVRRLRGVWSPVEQRVVQGEGAVFQIEARIATPPDSGDQVLRVRAELLQAGQVVGVGEELIEAEEGEVNWGDGIALDLPGGSPPAIRLTVAHP
jgi:hypothetical protein